MNRLKVLDVYSLRLLLTLLMLSGISVSVGISSWFSTRDAKHQIEELFDAQMLQTAKMLELFYHEEADFKLPQSQPQVLHVPDSQVSSFAEKADALKLAYEHKLAFQIWSEAGQALVFQTILGASRSLNLCRAIVKKYSKGSCGMCSAFFC